MPKLVYFEPKGLEYPLGFIVAPIYMHEGWEEGYRELFETVQCVERYDDTGFNI
ncbi:spore photoproduct lyase family protein [Bacillus cereus]|uniref:spore photoproduct lyase family protein n=1 Tax=Bacillus cereus TaxID=1396 RepID=UPI003D34E068